MLDSEIQHHKSFYLDSTTIINITKHNFAENLMYEKLKDYLSEERLKIYLDISSNNKEKAIELYELYTKINESLCFPLQNIEIIARNSFYNIIASRYGKNWIIEKNYLLTGLSRKKDLLIKQINTIHKDINNPNINDLISNVSFGFWCTLLDDDYEVEIWRPCLRKIFNNLNHNKKILRKDIRNTLKNIKKIRNRIFHHENLLKFNLNNSFNEITNFIKMLSNDMFVFTIKNTDFNEKYEKLLDFIRKNNIKINL